MSRATENTDVQSTMKEAVLKKTTSPLKRKVVKNSLVLNLDLNVYVHKMELAHDDSFKQRDQFSLKNTS